MRCGEPVEELDALLDTFGVEEGREFGEEDPPVKGAGVVVVRAEGLEPLVHAVVAQVVAARESPRDCHLAVLLSSLTQAMVGVGANGAVALIFGKVLSVDVRGGHEEGQGW